MIKSFIVTNFKATETLPCGKERTITKSVLSNNENVDRYKTRQRRIEAGTKALKAGHYYNIEYIGDSKTTLFFED